MKINERLDLALEAGFERGYILEQDFIDQKIPWILRKMIIFSAKRDSSWKCFYVGPNCQFNYKHQAPKHLRNQLVLAIKLKEDLE